MKEKEKQPEFRFCGFTDPWEQRKLEDVCSIQGGNAWKSEIYAKNGSHLVVTIANVTGDYYIDDTKGNRVDLDDENSPYILNKNDILVSLTGNVGRVSKMTRANAVLNQRVGRVKINDINKVEHDFLFNILKSAQFEESMKNASQGAAQANISNKDILSFVIKYPNLSEQQSIGSFFSTLDHLITLQQRELDSLKSLKKTLLSKLFPKNAESFPGYRFQGFNDPWEQRKLNKIAGYITKGTTPKDKSGKGNINFIKVENLLDGRILTTSFISEDEHNGYLKRSILRENDILFSIAGTLGRVACVEQDILPANTNQALSIIRNYTTDKNYLLTILSGKIVKDYIRKNPTVGAQPNLSLQQVGEIELQLPQLLEQRSIGSFFSTLDHLITLQQRELEILKAMKKTWLKKLFP